MTAMTYSYEVVGSAADEQTWTTRGTVTSANQGDFMLAVNDAMRQSFFALTDGKAEYGKPGVGCRGPYTMIKLSIETVRA